MGFVNANTRDIELNCAGRVEQKGTAANVVKHGQGSRAILVVCRVWTGASFLPASPFGRMLSGRDQIGHSLGGHRLAITPNSATTMTITTRLLVNDDNNKY